MEFHIYVDVNRHWRWRLVAANNKIIANSGEGYFNQQDCLHAIGLVQTSGSAPVYQV